MMRLTSGARLLDIPPLQADDTLHGEPFETLLKAFSSYGSLDPIVYRPLIPYFTRVTVVEGDILWKQGEPSDALYLIQSGVLRASYRFAASSGIEESMVAGSLAGELSAVSGTSRNATAVVERDAVLWRLGTDDLQRLEVEEPALARAFLKLILRCRFSFSIVQFACYSYHLIAAKVDYDILISALAARQ
jgi:sulfate permease, SulP family